jgi:hypothetical protein
MRTCAVFLVWLTVVWQNPAAARTITVLPDGRGDLSTIQEAADAASDGDLILLGNGVFRGTGNRDIDFRGKAITIRSRDGDPWRCVIDCEGSPAEPHRAFLVVGVKGREAGIEGIRITGGYASPGGRDLNGMGGVGGGIIVHGSSVSISHCVLDSIRVVSCGSIAIMGKSSPRIVGCTITDNSDLDTDDRAGGGGGIWVYDGSSPLIVDCQISRNYAATVGGGICVRLNSFPIIVNCSIWGNGAASRGGGVYVDGSSGAAIVRSVIGNCTQGEGIYCEAPQDVWLACCRVFGNRGGDWTSGIAPQCGVRGNSTQDPTAEAGTTSWRDGGCGPVGAWLVDLSTATGPSAMTDDQWRPGSNLSLSSPPDGTTSLTFQLNEDPQDGPVRLEIFDVDGRLVRRLADAEIGGRVRVASWDHTDGAGHAVPSGVYFCRLLVGDARTVRSLVVVK